METGPRLASQESRATPTRPTQPRGNAPTAAAQLKAKGYANSSLWKQVTEAVMKGQTGDALGNLVQKFANAIRKDAKKPARIPDNATITRAGDLREIIREEIKAVQGQDAPKAPSPRGTWAAVAATAHAASGTEGRLVPKVVPQQRARQILIKATGITADNKARKPADTVAAINRVGPGGAMAANALPSGDVLLTFKQDAYAWHAQDNDWVTKVFGHPEAKSVKTYAVLAKGVPKSILTDDVGAEAKGLSDKNSVRIHRMRPKFFSRTSKYAALLIEFTNIEDANRLCRQGLVWNAGYFPCEVYSGDLRPTLCYKCWQYGHKAKYCRKTAICPNCSCPSHEKGTICPATTGKRPYFCPSCKGPHGALSKECKEYKKQWTQAKERQQSRPTYFAISGPPEPAPSVPRWLGAPTTTPPTTFTHNKRSGPTSAPPAKRGRPNTLEAAGQSPSQTQLSGLFASTPVPRYGPSPSPTNANGTPVPEEEL